MIDRMKAWYNMQELNESEIAAGLGNGDINRPDWMGVSENTDYIKVWDMDNASSQLGFVILNY